MITPDGVRAARQRPSRSRSSSMQSDAPSTTMPMARPALFAVRPPPAYVATAAASQFVTDAHLHAIRSAEEPPSYPTLSDDVLFSECALAQINAFLDQLLYKFLATSLSIKLSPIQVAVENILRGKLGRLALARADTDLEALLDESDSDDLDFEEQAIPWDTDAYFRRTRLRIMVYMRLGEMEDEDEEEYVEDILAETGQRLGDDSEDNGLVSPAGAIFLTSILEYVAEVCLGVAGQAAYKRAVSRKTTLTPRPDSASTADQSVTVIEADVEKAGLDARLGRLWRSWKHKMRGPAFEHTRTVSNPRSGHTSRKASNSTLRSDIMATPTASMEPSLPTPNEEQELGWNEHIVDGTPADTSAGVQEKATERDVERTVRPTKQRPTSLNILSQAMGSQAGPSLGSMEEKATQTRLRAQTLDSSPIVAAGPFDPAKYQLDPIPMSQQPVQQFLHQDAFHEEARDGLGATPPRSPLPQALGSHPVRQSIDEDYGQPERSPPIVDQARAVSFVRPPRTDSVPRTDSASLESPRYTMQRNAAMDTEPSQGSSSRTSRSSADTQDLTFRKVPKVRSVDQMHSATAMRLKNDAFPKLDTSTSPTSPSTTQAGTASPYTSTAKAASPPPPSDYSRTSADDHQQSWLRKVSGASRQSRSNSKSNGIIDGRRPSKETLASNHSSGSRGGDSIAERPFSELIADRETIRLKLTPKQLERLEEPSSPADVPQNPYFPASNSAPPPYANPKSVTPARTFYAAASPIAEVPSPAVASSPQPPLSASRPSATNVKPTKTGFVAKEARVQTERVDDLAHFLRNTGPVQKQKSATDLNGRPSSSKGKPWKSSSRRNSGDMTGMMPKSAPATKNTFEDRVPPLPTSEPKSSRFNLTPREATVNTKRSPNSELIDFLRAGPPAGAISARTATSTQSSPTQPLSSTRGSLRNANGRGDASMSHRSSSMMTQSVHGSINSHSALLASTPSKATIRSEVDSTPLPTHEEAPPVGAMSKSQYRNKDPYALPDDDDEPQPAREEESAERRQYRNKDPYALPSDDEDEQELNALPVRKPQTQGESFMDFLKNTEPPHHATSAPLAQRVGVSPGGNEARQAPGQAWNYNSTRGNNGAPYLNGSSNANKLRKEKSGGMRSRIFGKKVGAA